MFVRQVYAHFKPGKFDQFSMKIEKDIVPLLKKQKGFRDELSFFDKDKKEAFAMSFWETKLDADNYQRKVYPEIHKKMEDFLDDMPKVRSFEVANSTWYNIHAA